MVLIISIANFLKIITTAKSNITPDPKVVIDPDMIETPISFKDS